MNVNFEKASHTAIISDLHLCEAEPVNPHYPLWKKYKTAEFFFDEVFVTFLSHLKSRAKGEKIELLLNGDIFDFDSVMGIPEEPDFRVTRMERLRGLQPREQRSCFKMARILKDHPVWVRALSEFIEEGNTAVFLIGNHDLELHFEAVQATLLKQLNLSEEGHARVRFVEWFYISNSDTLIEHGNQYDPYCVCEDPLNPYVQGYNYRYIKLPFGNLACRYLLNGMGYFNPHVDSNFIMTPTEYVSFFLKYMLRSQPLVIWTWFWGSLVTLGYSLRDRFTPRARNPLRIEDRVNDIAKRANATPRMVREMSELFVAPAASNPMLVARELWLDRAFLVLLTFYLLFVIFLFIRQVYAISVFWIFIPLFMFLPFFLFYSKSVISLVPDFKEPREKILFSTSLISKVNRVIYGHTHTPRHEWIGPVEHLNSGCWSPAFTDVQCKQPIDQKTYVWIEPDEENEGQRQASLWCFENGDSRSLSRT